MQIGSMSASALSQMHAKMFSKIDANSDGGVTLEELTASAPAGKNGQTESADSLKSRFSSMDANSDGSVSEEEGLSFFQSQMSSDTMSGMLQAQEGASGPPPMGPPPSGEGSGGGQAPASFDELDTNQDGTVSLAEMQASLSTSETEDTEESSRIAELFSAMDSDGDGSVTETEKSAFDEAMRAEGPPPPPGQSATAAATETSDTTDSQSAAQFAALTKQWLQSMSAFMAQEATSATTTSVAA